MVPKTSLVHSHYGLVMLRDADSLFFCETSTPTLALKNQDSNSEPKFQTLTLTPGCHVWYTDCVFQDEWRENLNSSDKRSQQCTIMYKQNFHCNWNWAKVSETAKKSKSQIDYRPTYAKSESPSKGRPRTPGDSNFTSLVVLMLELPYWAELTCYQAGLGNKFCKRKWAGPKSHWPGHVEKIQPMQTCTPHVVVQNLSYIPTTGILR